MKIELVIKGQPFSKSNRRRLVTFGNRPASIKSREAIAYENAALLQIPASMRVMLQGRLRITIHAYYTSERPDLDLSVVYDVMQSRRKGGRMIREGVYGNDRQLREKHEFFHIDRANPRCEIAVEEIG